MSSLQDVVSGILNKIINKINIASLDIKNYLSSKITNEGKAVVDTLSTKLTDVVNVVNSAESSILKNTAFVKDQEVAQIAFTVEKVTNHPVYSAFEHVDVNTFEFANPYTSVTFIHVNIYGRKSCPSTSGIQAMLKIKPFNKNGTQIKKVAAFVSATINTSRGMLFWLTSIDLTNRIRTVIAANTGDWGSGRQSSSFVLTDFEYLQLELSLDSRICYDFADVGIAIVPLSQNVLKGIVYNP